MQFAVKEKKCVLSTTKTKENKENGRKIKKTEE